MMFESKQYSGGWFEVLWRCGERLLRTEVAKHLRLRTHAYDTGFSRDSDTPRTKSVVAHVPGGAALRTRFLYFFGQNVEFSRQEMDVLGQCHRDHVCTNELKGEIN